MKNDKLTYADVFHEFFPHIHGEEMEMMLMEYTAYPMCGYDILRERLTTLKVIADRRDKLQNLIDKQNPLPLRAIMDGYEDEICLYLGQRKIFTAKTDEEIVKFINDAYELDRA